MPLLQLYLNSAGTKATPLLITTGLYGKFKVNIIGAWFNSTTSQAVQLQSRQFILPFAGAVQNLGAGTTIGSNINQSVRYPTFLLNSNQFQVSSGYAPLTFYADFDGMIELNLYDILGQTNAVFTACIISLDVEPVDTESQQEARHLTQNLAHTFTQLPIATYGMNRK